MSRRSILLLSGIIAVLVFAAGLAYTAVRHVHYESNAELVLVPTPSSSSQIANLTSSFTNSGTLGTYVEFISSINPEPNAGSAPVTVSVRGVPDTRAITVTTRAGTRDIVQPALQNVLTIAATQSARLNDAWSLHVLKNASAPSQSGPSTALTLLASALIGLLVGIVVYIALDRFGFAAPVAVQERGVEAGPGTE